MEFLIDCAIRITKRLISTNVRRYNTDMWKLNALGRFLCRFVAKNYVGKRKSVLFVIFWNALDSMIDGLDYMKYCDMYREFLVALEGDDSEHASELLMKMTCRYDCDANELGKLYGLIGETKHWKHFYCHYC
jgi:hypothetical protein